MRVVKVQPLKGWVVVNNCGWLTEQEGDYPMKPYQVPPNITVEITYSELDGTPVIQILTEDSPENEDDPICRVYLNDEPLFENPTYRHALERRS